MCKYKIAIASFLTSVLLFTVAGCNKAVTIVENPGNSITDEMSFAKDIIPIFKTNCALSGCHVPGAQLPDLSAADAYISLTGGNYITANDPDNSELIFWLTGKKSPTMPLGGSLDVMSNAKIYAWIKQGAKNN
ncbi:MAG: hypothetical protein EKK37_15245 [Sphingobacteriales bacterium]|nr:MAG: hypothetical protein EKK37_15245 [Sphingobacteriales bacterium]